MKEMSDLTVLFLHRMVCKRLDEVMRSIRRVEIYIERGVDKYESLAILQVELKELSNFRESLVYEIAYRNLIKDFNKEMK